MKIELFNHYPAPISFEQDSLLPALRKCLKHITESALSLPEAPLHTLEHLEFNLVDDQTISSLHEEFMNDGTTTDVITFQHGEVFVCYDVAQKEAQKRGITLREELFRYHVHGMLHLAGYDDLVTADYEEMHKLQEELVIQFL